MKKILHNLQHKYIGFLLKDLEVITSEDNPIAPSIIIYGLCKKCKRRIKTSIGYATEAE